MKVEVNQQVACHTLSEWEGDDIQAQLVNQAQRVTIRLGQSALLWSDWWHTEEGEDGR